MNYINKRVLEEANYIIQTGKTVREISSLFKVSKSTVHKDLHERLLKIDKEKYKNVEDILNPGRCPGLGDRRPSALGCAVMQNRNSSFITYH